MNRIVFTGSRVYGGATPNSDIDIVLDCNDAEKLERQLSLCGIKTYQTLRQKDNYEYSFYFELNNLKFNIISVYSEEIEAWAEATRKMTKVEVREDKQQRVNLFQTYFKEALL